MLKAVRLKNFINFEEEELLQFNNDGTYLFVGENNSGKSSVFEAIRRCMDMKSNFRFLTNVPNVKDPTYAVCDFSLPDDTRAEFKGCNRIVTSFVRIPNSASAKIVALLYEGQNRNDVVYMDIIFEGDYVHHSENVSCRIEEDKRSILIMNLTTLLERKNTNSNEFLETVSEIIKIYMESREYKIKRRLKTLEQYLPFAFRLIRIVPWLGNSSFMIEESTETESMLNKLSEHVVNTFSSRAVGGVQWSKSSKLSKGAANYSATSERCEIIRWFHEREEDVNYDTLKAKEIFETLTGGERFEFDFKESDGYDLLLVKNGRDKTFSILKCPEGILEAKHISLLLSYKPFRTLLLEEPDRGMHPQMIHRLTSIILAAEKNKTIIIVSHNAAFISPMLIPRTFKFCKISEATGNYRLQVVNIRNIIKQTREPIPRTADENYANVFFAKRILFVEGESDFVFIRSMFSHILNPETKDATNVIFNCVSELHKNINGVPLKEDDLKKLKYLLTSLYVLKLHGHGDKNKWHAFCEATYTPHIFLLDADAVVETTKLEEGSDDAKKRAASIHHNVAGLLKKAGIETKLAEKITDILRKKFLQENPSVLDCEIFSDKDGSIQQIVEITKKMNLKQENINMEEQFGGIDAKLYGKIYTDRIAKWTIPHPKVLQWKPVSKISQSRIVSDKGINDFQQCPDDNDNENRWTEARNVLKEYNLFVWKDGSLEDAILGIILATTTENAQTNRTDEIFRKYLAFYSLKIDLPLESFRKKHAKKLYLEKSRKIMDNEGAREDICDDDIQRSIDLVFKLCKQDSDVVHLLHFLTMYARKQLIQQDTEV